VAILKLLRAMAQSTSYARRLSLSMTQKVR